MKKLSTVVHCVLIAAAAVAAPTTNEDFVIAEDAQTFTNAVNAARAYTDAATNALDVGVTSVNGASGAVVIPAADFSTSNATLVATIEATAPAPGDYAAVSNAAMNAAQSQSMTNYATRAELDEGWWSEWTILRNGSNVTAQVEQPNYLGNSQWNIFYSSIGSDDLGRVTAGDEDATTLSWTATDSSSSEEYGPENVRYTATRHRVAAPVPTKASDIGAASSNDLSTVAFTGDYNDLDNKPTIPTTAADVGAYSAANGAALAGQVATIGAHLNAEDARFVVTNYNSVTHTPEAYVEIRLPDTSWSRIWSEMTRWNYLFNEYLPTNYYDKAAVNAAFADKADRAWGFYDSTTGAYAPDGYTWISSEKIAIAANLAYQRTVTAEGAIWVLESNGVVTETGGMTNGFFRISDDEGNSLFEIVKGNKRTVGADASSCQVVAGFSPTKLQVGYSIVSDVHPTLYVCQSLATQDWKSETDGDCIANVTWSGTSGAYVAQVQGKSAYSSMFVKATYEVGGETYISNAAPVSMQYIMIGGVKYAVGVGTVSGTTVLTLTVAQ